MIANQSKKLEFERILITGGDGFVGRHLIPALRSNASSARITCAGRSLPAVDDLYDTVHLDLLDAGSIDKAVRKVRPDLVIHLAAQASVAQSQSGSGHTWAINLGGSLHLARALAANVPETMVLFPSTAEVYGFSFKSGEAVESTPLLPQSAYARSKAAAEAMWADVLPATSRLIVARPSNHSGPGQDERFVIPAFAAQIARIEKGAPPAIRVGNLDATRDFMDVRDVVDAYIALLLQSSKLPMRSIFNIASGTLAPVSAILEQLMTLSGLEIEIIADQDRLRASEIPLAAVDASGLRAATGWSAKVSFEDMVRAVLADWRLRS